MNIDKMHDGWFSEEELILDKKELIEKQSREGEEIKENE